MALFIGDLLGRYTHFKGKVKNSFKAYKYGLFNFRKLIKFMKIVPDAETLKHTPQMTVFEAKELLDKGELVILDVRGKKDYDTCHIEGSILIDLFLVLDNLESLPRDKKIGVICYGGGASNTVAQLLLDRGFINVRNITGGIIRYALDGDESLLAEL